MPPKFKQKTLWLILLGFLLISCRQQKKQPPANPPPVEVVTVQRQSVPLEIEAVGNVEALASVQLKAKVSGEIVQVHFADGAEVQAGDALFSIDPQPYDVAVQRAQAGLDVSQAAATNAAQELVRYTDLHIKGEASQEQYTQYKASADSAQAQLEVSRADLASARLSKEWTTVLAPISGRVGLALLKKGNIVQANTDVLAVINQIKPVRVSFAVPENRFAEIRQWMAKGPLAVVARSSDTGRELDRGTLDFLDNAVDPNTGTVTLRAVFPNADEKLWPGQFIATTLRLTEEKDALAIPTTAIIEGQNGSQVLVVQEQKAALRPVTVERTFDTLTVIQSGLQAGETVISSGQLRVTPGTAVAPIPAGQKPAAPTGRKHP